MLYTLPLAYNSFFYYNIFQTKDRRDMMLIFDNDLNLKIYTLIEPSIAININYLEKMRERDEDFQMEKLNLTFTGLKDSYTFNVKV